MRTKQNATNASMCSGFTLLEVMMVLVILTLIAGLALPGYRDSVRKARRSDAHTSLSRMALLQERHYLNTNRYAGDFAELNSDFASGNAVQSDAGYYELVLLLADDGTGWALEAEAIGDQIADHACVRFVLDSIGTRVAFDESGSVSSQCW